MLRFRYMISAPCVEFCQLHHLRQVYGIISTAPWAMKALIGTVSDAVPLFGWHKARAYREINWKRAQEGEDKESSCSRVHRVTSRRIAHSR
jgi:hypothetical protein